MIASMMFFAAVIMGSFCILAWILSLVTRWVGR